MEIKGESLLSGSVEQVWTALNDPAVLAKCTPGCQVFEPIGEAEYKAIFQIDIGAVKGKYEGEVTIFNKIVQESYKMRIKASGLAGFFEAEGIMSIQPKESKTLLTYSIDAQVGGKVAGVGQRVLRGIAKLLSGRFFSALDRESSTIELGKVEGKAS